MSTELIDIQMPDGTIIHGVPKGVTQTEVLRRYQASQNPDLAARQATSRATFEANLPKYGFVNRAYNALPDLNSFLPKMSDLPAASGAALGMAAGSSFGPPGMAAGAAFGAAGGRAARQLYQQLAGSMEAPQTAGDAAMGPAIEAAQWGSQMSIPWLAELHAQSPVARGGDALISALKNRLPNAERAGNALEQIRQAATNEAPDLSKAYNIVQRAKELSIGAGHGPISRGMGVLDQAMQPATFDALGTPLQVNPPQIKYPQSFDMASAAKGLAAEELNNMTGMMQGQVRQFAKALQEANREVAERVGMGNVFDSAMKEYRQAKTLEAAMAIAKKYAIKAGIAGVLGAAGAGGATLGYDLYRILTGERR